MLYSLRSPSIFELFSCSLKYLGGLRGIFYSNQSRTSVSKICHLGTHLDLLEVQSDDTAFSKLLLDLQSVSGLAFFLGG